MFFETLFVEKSYRGSNPFREFIKLVQALKSNLPRYSTILSEFKSPAGPCHFSLELLQLLHENKIKTGPRGESNSCPGIHSPLY